MACFWCESVSLTLSYTLAWALTDRCDHDDQIATCHTLPALREQEEGVRAVGEQGLEVLLCWIDYDGIRFANPNIAEGGEK